MNRFFKTIKSKVTLVTISFTLVITLAFAFISTYYFQANIRKSVIQSTEFNLQLVSGIIAQDVSSLDTLTKWCSLNTQIISYLGEENPYPSDQLVAYNRLNEEYQNNRSNTYIHRLIITDKDFTRILQIGTGINDTNPVSIYNIKDTIFKDPINLSDSWSKIQNDPYDWRNPPDYTIIPVLRPIYNLSSHALVGYVYMAISTKIITDPLSDYAVAPESSLFIDLANSHYRINGTKFELLPNDYITKKAELSDNTFDSNTLVTKTTLKSGQSGTMVSYPLKNTFLVLSNSLSNQQIQQQGQLLFKLVIYICVSIMALGFFITMLLNRVINRPVGKLTKRINAISKGDFSSDPEIEWDNEFGDVGRGINKLSSDVVTLMETRLADEKKKQELEYQMLQSQINPHFIYNTLNSIKWMATIQNATGIAEMTTSLSRLLKSISKGTHKLIPLKEELALMDDYFVIQKYRYGGSITLTKIVSEEVCDNKIPRFTLQPLIENAIFHGIEPKGGAGKIELTGCLSENNSVKITIQDDGVGMDESTIKKIFSGDVDEPSGLFQQLGILNVHKRIQYEFGDLYGISITSEPGVYTKMTITLPRQPCE